MRAVETEADREYAVECREKVREDVGGDMPGVAE